jgi:uncharacterized phage infection (PIP) family protein YhgE
VLSAKTSDFCNSPEHQIWLLKSNISEQADKNAEVQAAINRLTDLLDDFGTLVRGLDSKVTQVDSKVTQVDSKVTQVDSQSLISLYAPQTSQEVRITHSSSLVV